MASVCLKGTRSFRSPVFPGRTSRSAMTDVKWWGGVGAEYYCNAVMYTPTLICSDGAIKAGEDK